MKKLLVLIAGIVFSFSSFSQNLFSTNIKVYDPKGALNQNIDHIPVGISFSYWRDSNTKFALGGEMGIAMYTQDTYDLMLDNGDVIEVSEEDCFWTLHVGTRYFLIEETAVKPYAEARVGMTTFFSSRIATDENADFEDTFEFHGTAWNTAIGGGFLLDFNHIFNGTPGDILLDAGVNFHSGTSASYRNFEMVDGTAATLDDGTFQTLTNYVDYKIGVAFLF